MGTQRQIESARINGVKSRGPKTLEGKRRSSLNSRKHGLASKTIAPDPETVAAFSAAVAQYVADLRPASPAELLLIDQMAAAKIRQRQAWAAETEAWNRALATHDGCLAKAAETLAASGEWACIMRYEIRFGRQYHRALQQLLTARKLRLRNEPDPSTARNVILPNEPDWSAFTERRTNNDERRTPHRFCQTNRNGPRSPNDERATTNDERPTDFAKRTGSSHPRRRCSHQRPPARRPNSASVLVIK